jgi:hypothetical protein
MANYTSFESRATRPLDFALLLVVYAHPRSGAVGNYVQNLVFCIELACLRSGRALLPDFHFMRGDDGPYSYELAESERLLAKQGFIDRPGGALTAAGGSALHDLQDVLSKDPELKATLSETEQSVIELVKLGSTHMTEYVYRLMVPSLRGDVAVRDLPKGADLIMPSTEMLPDVNRLRPLIDLVGMYLAAGPERWRREMSSEPFSEARSTKFLSELGER